MWPTWIVMQYCRDWFTFKSTVSSFGYEENLIESAISNVPAMLDQDLVKASTWTSSPKLKKRRRKEHWRKYKRFLLCLFKWLLYN